MDATQIISLIINVLFGGGLIFQFVQLSSIKRKGEAEADKMLAEVRTTELDNVQEAVKIWREMAEALKTELLSTRNTQHQISEKYEKMALQVETFRKDINKLTTNINKMMKMLDKITPENLEQTVDQIRKIHETT